MVSVPAFAQDAPPPLAAPAPPVAAPADMPPPPPPPVVIVPPPAEPMAVVPPSPSVVVVPPAVVASPPWYNVVKTDLLVDSYYMYNFSSGDLPSSLSGPGFRNFDTQSNSFSLNYAKVGLQLDSEPISVRIDLGYGHTGSLINAAGGGSSNPEAAPMLAGSLYANAFFVQQAFASLRVPGTALTVDFGKFVTTAGAEVIEANKNWLYSRSFLFYIIPLVHTGARLNFKVNDMISLQASLVNGWNNDPDNNSAKTGGVSVAITPVSTTSIIATSYFGKEGPQGMSGDVRIVGDLVVNHNISDKFGVNLNVDYVKQGETYAAGGSLMGRFVALDHLVLAARGEYLKNNNLPLLLADSEASLYEGTLMVGVPFAGHLEARAEVRVDAASEPVFNGQDNQVTGTVAFLGFM